MLIPHRIVPATPPLRGLLSQYGLYKHSRYFLSTGRPRSTSSGSENPEEVASAKQWLTDFSASQIPRGHFAISYSRSLGPGGQKVNKTSSKATVSLEPWQWLNPQILLWVPKPVLAQLAEQKIRYQTKSNGILIQSDFSRNREVNTDECFRKLLAEIKAVVHFEGEVSDEDVQKWELLAKKEKEHRKENKKFRADKKRLRSKNFDI